MGVRGPHPQPDKLKVLHGRPSHEKKQKLVDRKNTEIPTPPKFLSSSAKYEWKRICEVMKDQNVITKADRAALASYCTSYARWKEAEALIDAEGMVLVTDKGYSYQHPAVSIAQKERMLMRQFLTELGLTPSSRARLNVQSDAKEEDPFEELLNKCTEARGMRLVR